MTHSSLVKYRYFFNTVTFSYTTAFYSFDDWELLFDWMALRGVNLPLAWVGYEYILIQVFREAGLSDSDISNFLSSPPFQAWNRFGKSRVAGAASFRCNGSMINLTFRNSSSHVWSSSGWPP